MQLTLNTHEIEQAIEMYVNSQGVSTDGKAVDISLLAKRGANAGVEATVNITDKTLNSPESLDNLSEQIKEVVDSIDDIPEENTEENSTPSKSLFGNE